MVDNNLVQFHLEIHILTVNEKEIPGSQNHIRYLNSPRTWNQLCGQEDHEEEPEEKTWAQGEEKLGQDEGNLGSRNEREGAQLCQTNTKRKLWDLAVRVSRYSWEIMFVHRRGYSLWAEQRNRNYWAGQAGLKESHHLLTRPPTPKLSAI